MRFHNRLKSYKTRAKEHELTVHHRSKHELRYQNSCAATLRARSDVKAEQLWWTHRTHPYKTTAATRTPPATSPTGSPPETSRAKAVRAAPAAVVAWPVHHCHSNSDSEPLARRRNLNTTGRISRHTEAIGGKAYESTASWLVHPKLCRRAFGTTSEPRFDSTRGPTPLRKCENHYSADSFRPGKGFGNTMQTRLVKTSATRKASICRLEQKHDDPRDAASAHPLSSLPTARRPRPASPVPPLPPAEAYSGASGGAPGGAPEHATDLAKASCANRRRHRSHILGWAQGVNGHPRLVPKGRKESRKATAAIKSGSGRRITPSNRTQFALPPLFGEGA